VGGMVVMFVCSMYARELLQACVLLYVSTLVRMCVCVRC